MRSSHISEGDGLPNRRLSSAGRSDSEVCRKYPGQICPKGAVAHRPACHGHRQVGARSGIRGIHAGWIMSRYSVVHAPVVDRISALRDPKTITGWWTRVTSRADGAVIPAELIVPTRRHHHPRIRQCARPRNPGANTTFSTASHLAECGRPRSPAGGYAHPHISRVPRYFEARMRFDRTSFTTVRLTSIFSRTLVRRASISSGVGSVAARSLSSICCGVRRLARCFSSSAMSDSRFLRLSGVSSDIASLAHSSASLNIDNRWPRAAVVMAHWASSPPTIGIARAAITRRVRAEPGISTPACFPSNRVCIHCLPRGTSTHAFAASKEPAPSSSKRSSASYLSTSSPVTPRQA